MAGLARGVAPGVRHHITERGNRRDATFFSEADYVAYLELMVKLLDGHERTARPLGNLALLKRLERRLGRVLRKEPPGRKPKTNKK